MPFNIRPLFPCLIALLMGMVPAYAQSTDDSDWPEDIEANTLNKSPSYFNKSDNPIIKRFNDLEREEKARQADPQAAAKAATPQKKKGIWPFQKKQRPRPLSDQQVIEVGPRQTAPTRDPLLALPVNLELPDGGILPSGFYLIRQKALDDHSRQWQLVKENKTLFSCVVHRTGSQTVNADSPLSVTNPNLPSRLSPVMKVVIAPVNENQPQTATLVLQEGGDRFESDAFPVITDKRPKLRND